MQKLSDGTNNLTEITAYYQNSRGLCTKQKEFFSSAASYDYDLVILTETWLKDWIFDAEYFTNSYSVYRKDRDLRRGGGVLIATKNDKLSSEELVLAGTEKLEYVCVKASTKLHNIYVYCAYIPPNSPSDLYKSHLAAIHSIATDPDDVLLIVGDFNLPKVQWSIDDDDQNVLIPTVLEPAFAADYINGLMSIGVHQINNIRNKNDKLLDLIFTNDITNISIDHAKPLTKVDAYHPPILATFEWHGKSNDPKNNTTRAFNFKRGNYLDMNTYLSNIDFVELFRGKSLDEKVDVLHSILNEAIKLFVPTYVVKSYGNCPWNNKQLQSLKNKKNKAWKKFKRTGDKEQFDVAFDKFDKLNTELYIAYVEKMKLSLKTDPSMFWNYVNSLKNTNNQPKTMRLADKKTSSEPEQANLFADFFGSNYSAASTITEPSQLPENTANFMFDLVFVMVEMTKVNTKKGVGPDGIHPMVLKHCSPSLAEPLTELFNDSLRLGVFPKDWKRSSVTPIFKKGARSDIANYRCIAKLPTIAKFFEHLVNVKLWDIVRDNITPQQHGFMKGRSSASNLSEFIYFVRNGLNYKAQVDVLYTDFSKAFDRVDHNALIQKLRAFNLPQNLLSWLESYLANRVQFVKFGTSISDDFKASSGVPQGSHLGPTLFLLFINDIIEKLPPDVMILLYADDLKIAKVIKTQQDTELLQTAIDKLKLWCDTNNLHLNLDKCAVLTISNSRNKLLIDYTYGDHTFKRVNEHKDLGVLIDNKLSFAKHIDMITSKATAALGFVKRFCYDITDISTLKSLYFALVQSHLDYCNVVWLPFHKVHKDKIESIQKQFTMFARKEYPTEQNQYKITSYKRRLEDLNMISLRRRRVNSSLTHIYDIINGTANCPLVRENVSFNQERTRRNSERIKVTDKNMKISLDVPIVQMCKMANTVSDLFVSSTSRTNFISSVRSTPDDTFKTFLEI